MKILIAALALFPAAVMAQSVTSSLFDDTATPLHSDSAMAGSMLTNDTELLTPGGIIDTPTRLNMTQGLMPQAPASDISVTTSPLL